MLYLFGIFNFSLIEVRILLSADLLFNICRLYFQVIFLISKLVKKVIVLCYLHKQERNHHKTQSVFSLSSDESTHLQIYPQCRLFPSVLKIKFVKKSSIRRDGTFLYVMYITNT